MSISNIARMREALIQDELNYIRTMSREDLENYVEAKIRNTFELLDNDQIEELYEDIA